MLAPQMGPCLEMMAGWVVQLAGKDPLLLAKGFLSISPATHSLLGLIVHYMMDSRKTWMSQFVNC